MTSTNLFRVSASMNRLRLFVCCLVALGLGCKKDATFSEPVPAYAHVIWLNAVSDTGQLDMRVVDIATNASFMDADFRTTQPFLLPIEPGARHIKVFNSSTIDTIASKVLLDTIFTFAENQPYSFFLTGFARPGGPIPLRATISTLAPPTPPAGQFALRVLNLAPSLAGTVRAIADTSANVDAFLIRTANAFPTGAPAIANAGYGVPTPYVNVDTGTYRLALTTTGATDPSIVQAFIPAGVAGSSGTGAIAGSGVAGSVLTAIILPRSVPGSSAPQTRPTALRTDTSVSQAATRITRSNDTVTVQVGSTTIVVNRRGGSLCPTICPSRADTTLARTGTAASGGVAAGNLIQVSGATQPEYNGWFQVLSVVDTLICNPSDPGDVPTGANRRCAPPADTTVASAGDTARTIFRFRYRVLGTPATPGSGTVVYRLYPVLYTASDFAVPQIVFVADKRF
jgi:hypothetical protein